jgi:hypothetical protein
MLAFKEENDLYVITESIMGFSSTSVKTVTYTKDLSRVKVNDEPWRDTYPAQRDWFNNHHLKHFVEPKE